MTPQPSTAWRQQHCQISALHVKITNLGTVQVTQSTVRVQEVVTMMGVQKCQRLVTETRKTTKGRVAAPVGALGCLVVRLGNSTHQRSFAQHKAHHHHAVPVAVQVNRQHNCSGQRLSSSFASPFSPEHFTPWYTCSYHVQCQCCNVCSLAALSVLSTVQG